MGAQTLLSLDNPMATNHKEMECKLLCEPNGILWGRGPGSPQNSISLANLAQDVSGCKGAP